MSRTRLISQFLITILSLIAMGNRSAWCSSVADPLLAGLERNAGSAVRYDHHPRTGKLRFLGMEHGGTMPRKGVQIAPDETPEAAALGFMKDYGPLFGVADPERELKVRRRTANGAGHNFVRYQQVHQGVPVFGGELVVQTGEKNGVVSISGKAVPDLQLDVYPTITPEEAKETALGLVSKHHRADRSVLRVSEPELTIYNPVLFSPGLDANTLVWRLEVSATDLSPIRELVLVDARRGSIALHFNQVPHAKSRSIYDHNNVAGAVLPGTLVRSEGGPTSAIADVNYAYDYSGYTYDFYFTTHGRNSIDNAGMTLISTVRYCESGEPCPYQNAFWNGDQMVYGQGFTSSKDVVGHELTHGVTEKESNLFYYMQSGAINESLSDVWGEFIDQGYAPLPSAANRWLMGDAMPGGAIRSMKDPTVYGDPDKMTSANYRCADGNFGSSDMGGVHTNSGINNKAAYLMTDGGSFNGKTVTALGIAKVAKIYYEAQTNLMVSASDYGDLYNLLQQACSNLTATGVTTAADCTQVKNALDAVQMNTQPTNCAAPEAALCTPGKPLNVFSADFESKSGWSVQTSTGSAPWGYLTQPYATSGVVSFWGPDAASLNNTIGFTAANVTIPANAFLHFRHVYDFEFYDTEFYDGGVVEYSTNGGSTWTDMGTLGPTNGYNGTIYTGFGNLLAGRSAFVGLSNGYKSSRLSLSSLAGQSIRIGFRSSSDSSVDSVGWLIDDVRVYTCDATLPTVTTKNPVAGATNVTLSTKPTATFSESMDAATLSTVTYTLTSGSLPLTGTVTYDTPSKVATFTPGAAATLAPGKLYTATVTTGATDLAGNNMAANSTWTFTTNVSGSCTVRMDGGLCFPAVSNAYGVAILNSRIETASALAKAAVLINRGIPVTLAGGYSDATFPPTGRTTTKVSSITVSSGTLTVDGITVQ